MTPLYQRILAGRWEALPPALRAAHSGPGYRSRGRFRITLAKHPFAHFLRWIASLPAPTSDCEVTLAISGDDTREHWLRHFNARPLSTTQHQSGSLLAERFRALQIRFHLSTDGGQLTFEQRQARLCLGPLRIALPSILAPRIRARESALDDGSIHVQVIIHAPLVGELMRYEGHITTEPPP